MTNDKKVQYNYPIAFDCISSLAKNSDYNLEPSNHEEISRPSWNLNLKPF
jgi:hypothetical protein